MDEVANPRAGSGQVVVALEAAPVHALDLDGLNGIVPATVGRGGSPGLEGVGRVVEVGEGVAMSVGARVLLPLGTGTWRDRVAVSAHRVLPAPEGVDARQLALVTLAPIMAYTLLTTFVDLQPGEWIVQNAAGGAVGRHVTRLAHARGVRTLNVAHHKRSAREIQALGGDVVAIGRDDLPALVARVTGGARVRLALDAVGGDATSRLAASVNLEGTVVTYGLLSGLAPRLEPLTALVRDVTWQGCWLPNRLPTLDPSAVRSVVEDAVDAVTRGMLLPIAGTFPLTSVADAVAAAGSRQRRGKVLLTGEAWTG